MCAVGKHVMNENDVYSVVNDRRCNISDMIQVHPSNMQHFHCRPRNVVLLIQQKLVDVLCGLLVELKTLVLDHLYQWRLQKHQHHH